MGKIETPLFWQGNLGIRSRKRPAVLLVSRRLHLFEKKALAYLLDVTVAWQFATRPNQLAIRRRKLRRYGVLEQHPVSAIW